MSARLVTARVVAERLDVTPGTVLRWTRNGTLPGIKLPSGQIRYDADQLEAWLASRATPISSAHVSDHVARHSATLSDPETPETLG